MNDAHERTERPTARRLAKTRAEGAWPSSAVASGWLAFVLMALPAFAALHVAGRWIALWRVTLLHAAARARDSSVPDLTGLLGSWFLWGGVWEIIGAAAAAALVAAIGSASASGALTFSPAALRIRSDRLSWSAGVRQLVNADAAAQLMVATACIAIALSLSWASMRALQRIAAAELSLGGAAIAGAHVVRATWWGLVVLLAIPVCIDVLRVRRRAVQASRMTPREVRDERAEVEGKPELRARRRALAANSRNIHIGAIRRATAVVANPTHVAIALRYAPPRIDVPIVVSRGADLAAALVRVVAAMHDVPIIESPELARTLYARVALGEQIPEECYAAVAAVFAWLMHTRGSLPGADGP